MQPDQREIAARGSKRLIVLVENCYAQAFSKQAVGHAHANDASSDDYEIECIVVFHQ